jgi:hypothetical protein
MDQKIDRLELAPRRSVSRLVLSGPLGERLMYTDGVSAPLVFLLTLLYMINLFTAHLNTKHWTALIFPTIFPFIEVN